MTACGWASSEWRRPMSSAAPTSAECVCTRGGRSAGAVGNHARVHAWKTGDQKSLAVEWAPVGAKKCLVARVEILMGAEPTMTSFLVEDLDEVLELSD